MLSDIGRGEEVLERHTRREREGMRERQVHRNEKTLEVEVESERRKKE